MNKYWTKLLTALLAACFAYFIGHLLFSAASALSSKNFLMSDYGVYSNTLYNLAHFNGFRFMVDHSYLKTHLSFSLILLAPLCRIFPSPLLLLLVQWLFLAGGCAILFRIMQKLSVPVLLRWAVLFYAAASHMTQSVMLSEFHGVSAYYLLLPWLCHEVLFRRKAAFLPVLVILGLREDAGLMILPILLYFAVTLKWRTGYILAALTLLYVIVATTVLYPFINGTSLLEVRAAEASSEAITESFNIQSLTNRGRALIWIVLPAALFLVTAGRRGAAVSIFPAIGLTAAMLSAMPRQHCLTFHYPAPIVAAMLCGMAIAFSSDNGKRSFVSAVSGLVLLTMISHFSGGFFLMGRASNPVYSALKANLSPLLDLANTAPKEGLLVANQKLAPFFAMRKDIMVWHYFDASRHNPDLIVCDLKELQDKESPARNQLENGNFSLHSEQLPYFLFIRGETKLNSAYLSTPMIAPALMLSHAGSLAFIHNHGISRYWNGNARKAPATLAYGKSRLLQPGRYNAVFTLKSKSKKASPEKGFGTISVHILNRQESISSAEIAPADIEGREFYNQSLTFSLDSEQNIEPRITGGGAELWAKLIQFLPAE